MASANNLKTLSFKDGREQWRLAEDVASCSPRARLLTLIDLRSWNYQEVKGSPELQNGGLRTLGEARITTFPGHPLGGRVLRVSSRALGEQDATSSARRHCTDLLLGGFGGFLGACGGF